MGNTSLNLPSFDIRVVEELDKSCRLCVSSVPDRSGNGEDLASMNKCVEL